MGGCAVERYVTGFRGCGFRVQGSGFRGSGSYFLLLRVSHASHRFFLTPGQAFPSGEKLDRGCRPSCSLQVVDTKTY